LPAWAAHATAVVVVIRSGDALDKSRGYVVGVRDGAWGVGGLSWAAAMAARTAQVDDGGDGRSVCMKNVFNCFRSL
jgi:hypothetical protein